MTRSFFKGWKKKSFRVCSKKGVFSSAQKPYQLVKARASKSVMLGSVLLLQVS